MKYGQTVLKKKRLTPFFALNDDCTFCVDGVLMLFNKIPKRSKKILIKAFDEDKRNRVELYISGFGGKYWDAIIGDDNSRRCVSLTTQEFNDFGVEPKKDTYIWLEGTPCE